MAGELSIVSTEPETASASPLSVVSSKPVPKVTPADIERIAKQYNVPADLAVGVAHIESANDPLATSNKGAQGIMQLMPACVTTDTLCLTSSGWKQWNEIITGEEILTFSLKKGVMEFQPVRAVFFYDTPGPLVHMFNQRFDFVVTENHKWVVEYRPTGKSGKVGLSLKETSELRSANPNYIVRIADFKFPKRSGADDAVVYLAGLIFGDGTIGKNGSSIMLYQKKKVAEYRRAVIATGLKFTERGPAKDGMYRWNFYGQAAMEISHLVYRGGKKRIPVDVVRRLTLEQAELLWNGVLESDGYKICNGWQGYSQADLNRAQDIQLLLFMLGKLSNLSMIREAGTATFPNGKAYKTQRKYAGLLLRRKTTLAARSRLTYEYQPSEAVWCPSVDNGTWVAYRDGRISITGNTGKRYGVTDPYDPEQNITGGVKYLRDLLKQFNGDRDKALAAYNWGEKHVADGKEIPSSVQKYVKDVSGKAKEHAQENLKVVSTEPETSSGERNQFMAVPDAKGLVEAGNLPIWNRPTVKNHDGSRSTEYSISQWDDRTNAEVLIPTVVNGKFLTPDGKKPPEGSAAEKAMFKEAWRHYLKTGENLGKFKTADDADKYANILHERGEQKKEEQKPDLHIVSTEPAQSTHGQEKPMAGAPQDIAKQALAQSGVTAPVSGPAAPPPIPERAGYITGAPVPPTPDLNKIAAEKTEANRGTFSHPLIPHGEEMVEQHRKLAETVDAKKHPVIAWLADADVVGVQTLVGLSSPVNVAILGAMAFAPEASVEKKMVDLGFSWQMAKGAYEQFKAAWGAHKKGDDREARRQAGGGALSAFFAALAGHGAVKGEKVIGSKEEPVYAETNETVGKQVDALKAGTVSTVMIPQGGEVPAVPEGMQSVKVDKGAGAGTYIFDPKKVSAETVRQAAESGKHGELLGHVQSKAELVNKPKVVVQARADDGTPVQESVVENKPEVVAAQTKVLEDRHPDAEVTVTTPQEVVAERAGKPLESRDAAGEGKEPVEAETAQEGAPASTEPASIIKVPLGSLRTDPNRFQYKLNVDEKGASNILKGRKWNPDLAGVVSVWQDPHDEELYVVNGHHRVDLARDNNVPSMDVRVINADNAKEARSIGALQNIAEGRGSAVDAAKFFRDTGRGEQDLGNEGITLSESKASDGVALANLSQPIFDEVATGKMRIGRGVAIGDATDDHAQQEAILKMVEKREKGGRAVPDSVVAELGRMVKGAGEHTETQDTLFGVQSMTRNLALEKAEVSDYIRKQIGSEKKLFSGVSTESTAQRLGKAGNVIDAGENAKIATQAAQAQELYDRFSVKTGEINDILNRAADELANGESPNAVKQRAYEEARAALSQVIGQGVEDRGAGVQTGPRSGEAEAHAEPAAGVEQGAVEPNVSEKSGERQESVSETPAPTLPGMESVPAERAEAAAGAQGEQLTGEAAQPAGDISRATGEMERKSPLFRDSEAGGQGNISFGMTIPGGAEMAEAADAFYKADIEPKLQEMKRTLPQALQEIREIIAPRADVEPEALDTLMRLTGEQEKHRYLLDQMMHKWRQMFDKVPEENQIEFFDRAKKGERQPTQQLQEVNDFMRKTDDAQIRRVVEAQVRGLSDKAQQLWNKFSEDEKTAFIRNISKFKAEELPKEGEEGGIGELTRELADGLINYKANHMRVMWETLPAKLEEEEDQGELFEEGEEKTPESGVAGEEAVKQRLPGRKSLFGSKGFLRHSTLDDMSEGIERGGVPFTYNPVEMFQRTQADAERYITAMNMWHDAKDQGARVFVKGWRRGPEGFERIANGRIGNVQFKAASREGMIHAGNWWLRKDYARLMNNYLGEDWIRNKAIGRGLVNAKNGLTLYRLGLSFFHAMTTSVSGMGSEIGFGMRELVHGARGGGKESAVAGLKHIGTAMLSPQERVEIGWDAVRYMRDPEGFAKTPDGESFLKSYPTIKQYIDDAFHAGAKFGLHEDEKLQAVAKLKRAWANADWEKNPLGATWKLAYHAPFSIIEMTSKPLFEYYVPLIKLGGFLREQAFNLADYQDEMATGKMTRGQVSRKSWDGVDDLFGQVNWDKFFWDRAFKTTNQILFRAGQWFSGNIRLVKRGVSGQLGEFLDSARYARSKFDPDYKSPSWAKAVPRLDPDFAKIAGLGLAWVSGNALLQMAMTSTIGKDKEGKIKAKLGELPEDMYDFMAARVGGTDIWGKPNRLTLPSVVYSDLMSLWFHGARPYLSAKISDLLGGTMELVQNRDYANNMIHDPDASWWNPKARWQDLKFFVGAPIAVSNTYRMARTGEAKVAAGGVFGFRPPPSTFGWTPAERSAYEMLMAKRGSLTPDEQDDLDAYLHLRSMEKLPAIQQKRSDEKAKAPILVRLVTRSTKGQPLLSVEELLHLYDKGTDQEKTLLRPLIRRRHNEIKKILIPKRKEAAMKDYLQAVHPQGQ